MTPETEERVAQHYAHGDLEQAILDALVASGKDVEHLAPDDLSPVDEFHTGGRQATVDLAEQAGFAPGMHLLDIGCGIGGPSRYFATERGCRVTGIDLTEDYVRTAEALARRVGLDGRVSYRQASALALPFEASTFDGAYMMHVGMNIEDKPKLFAEVRRVLKPGGDVRDLRRHADGRRRAELSGPLGGERRDELRRQPGGLSPRRWKRPGSRSSRSATAASSPRGSFAEVTARIAEAGGPPPLGIHILMKDIRAEARQRLVNLEKGLIAPTELIARAR